MKLIRDGKEIELTQKERMAIYNEVFTDILRQDISERSRELGYTPTKYQCEEMVENFENALNFSDAYWEAYWDSCEDVIEDVMTREEE